MFLRRLFLYCAWSSVGLSMGLLWPGIVTPAALGQMPAEAIREPEQAEVLPEGNTTPSLQLDIEERFEAVENEQLLDYRFAGNENEIIVIYTEANDGSSFSEPNLLFSSEGGLTPAQGYLYYPADLDFNESAGIHVAYRLPETGEYVLRMENELTNTATTLRRIRSASYYERLMIAAVDKQFLERYDEAAQLFGLAIAQRPEQPTPYASRITVYGIKVLENSEVQAELEGIEDPGEIIEIMHTSFLTLEADEQALMIDDLKQVATVYEQAIANGDIEADYINPEDLIGLSEFLETGVSNEAIQRLLFDIDR